MMAFSDRLVVRGGRVRLRDFEPSSTPGADDKSAAEAELATLRARLGVLQYKMWAQNRHALLVVLQGVDTSGKDGVIRHVFTGMNPAGIRVNAFKAPSEEELDHDFLWRIHKAVPGRGEVAVFNRSHYEDVLVVRVERLVAEKEWRRRYAAINAFESLLTGGYVTIRKFFLHISRAEQRERLRARLTDPTKLWKYRREDAVVQRKWDRYQRAYEDMLSKCSPRSSPWYIVPSDRKWYRNLAVARVLVETLEGMRLAWPKGPGRG